MRRHGKRMPERELSSYTFHSTTPIDISETDVTWRYKSHWNDDECLSQQLNNILNPDLDSHNQEKNILLILEKLNRSEKDTTDKGDALQHTLDEIVYVITNFLIKKHKKPEKAIKKFKKNFSNGSDLWTWLVQHEYAAIYDSDKFDLKEYIGHENESNFWITIQKLIVKYFQIEIELQKSAMLNWPCLWSQTFKQSLSIKLKEISPDKAIPLSPHSKGVNDRFDEANLHHSANKTAEDWYKEFLCRRDHKMDNKQKVAFIKQTKHRQCDGCGHSIKTNKSDIKSVIIYNGGWPQEQKFVFHDENCVKVRKYLEAIRQFVFDVDMYVHKNRRMSPLSNWRRLLYLIQNKDYVLSIKQKIPRPLRAVHNESWDQTQSKNQGMKGKYRTNFIPKTEIASFRRRRKLAQYHLQIELIQTISFFNEEQCDDYFLCNLLPNDIYNENVDFQYVYGLTNSKEVSIPKIIRFMDIPQFGPSLFVYCLRSLEIKDRCGLWIIIQFIMAHLPTSSSISLLQRHKNELLRFPKDNLNKLCLKIIQSSQFPIATSLYLCGYMSSCYTLCGNVECTKFAALYTKIAIQLCLFIESDHLLAILLEIPSDISELSILDICVQYKLVDFLYSHRLRPIFNQMWTQFKYLDPSQSFQMKTFSYFQIFNNLRLRPSQFYYSPQGLFITEVFYFLIYIVVFTTFLMQLSYPYNIPITDLELILWIFNGGYLIKEFMEAIYKKNSYLSHFSKYWDILIVINWIIIAAIRWPWAWLTWDQYVIYEEEEEGNVDEAATRNQPLTIAYMSCVGIQSILIWTRTIPFLQRSAKTGPLIHTIFRLISDVWQFTILLMLFLIGCMFALYYILGSDVDDDADGSSLLLYMFQALLGQQDWDLLKPSLGEDGAFGVERSKMSQALVVFFSIIGNIALLNLLIALMASVYEQNAPLTAKQVNYSSILNTIELVDKEALLPSPFNLLVLLALIIYFVFEILIYFLCCSRCTYNIQRCALNKNYALNRDWVHMEAKEMEQLLLLNTPRMEERENRNNKYASIGNKRLSESSGEESDDEQEEDEKYEAGLADDKLADNMLSHKDEEMLSKYEEQREVIERNYKLWEKKEFHSIKCALSAGNVASKMYCRFCRNRMSSNGDIKVYFFLFRHFKVLDEADKTLLVNLLRNKILCPACFRPIKFYQKYGDSTRLWRWQVSMEIISFYVFMLVGYAPLLLFLVIPMIFESVLNRFTLWTSNLMNDSETKAKYKQQAPLNSDNVIFGGGDTGQSGEDGQFKHISQTIHTEYCNFIRNEANEGNNYMILPQKKNSNKQTAANHNNNNNAGGCGTNNGLPQINEEHQIIMAMKPVHTKLTQKKTYSTELSPVIDSPLPMANNMNPNANNNSFKEILIKLTEIKKELNVLQKHSKMKSDSNSKRRDSKPTLINTKRQRMNLNHNENENENGNNEELSIPSMPSMPESLQTTQDSNGQRIHYRKHFVMKPSPSKQQRKHDAVIMSQTSPRRQQSNESEDSYNQQALHELIDDMSVNSIQTQTATTVHHRK